MREYFAVSKNYSNIRLGLVTKIMVNETGYTITVSYLGKPVATLTGQKVITSSEELIKSIQRLEHETKYKPLDRYLKLLTSLHDQQKLIP